MPRLIVIVVVIVVAQRYLTMHTANSSKYYLIFILFVIDRRLVSVYALIPIRADWCTVDVDVFIEFGTSFSQNGSASISKTV